MVEPKKAFMLKRPQDPKKSNGHGHDPKEAPLFPVHKSKFKKNKFRSLHRHVSIQCVLSGTHIKQTNPGRWPRPYASLTN